MTDAEIQHQIEVIRRATAKARKSKESAQQFLIDAGIIKGEKKVSRSTKKKKTPLAYHQSLQNKTSYMASSAIDKELIWYFTRLDEAQKRSLVEMMKSFLKSGKEPPHLAEV